MADRSGSGSAASSEPGPERAGKMGRRAALALYFVLLAYAVVVGYGTVLQMVYSGPTRAEVADVRGVSCESGYAELAADLDTGLSRLPEALVAHASGPSGSAEPLTAFFDAWDHRYRPLAARCPGQPFPELLRLRHHLELSLRRFEREEAPLIAQLRARVPRSGTTASPHENP